MTASTKFFGSSAGAPAALTVRQAADEVICSDQTVRNWIRSGVLPAVKVCTEVGTGLWLIERHDWERFRDEAMPQP